MDEIEHRRTYPLFCRKDDLAILSKCASKSGITVIASRPQMGKTRLLVELLHELQYEKGNCQYLTGYSEATNEDQDLLLRAVQSLYCFWMDENTLFSQAKQLWKKNKKDLIGRMGLLTAKLLETVFKDSFGSTSSLIADTLKSLVIEQQGQSLTVPKLSYQQCFELLHDIYSITEKPIVLVLDAFEQLPDPLTLKTILSKILSFLQNWPPLHIFISVRNTYPRYISSNEWFAWKCVEDLKRESSLVYIHELKPLIKDNEIIELIEFTRKRVPAAKYASDETILDMMQGHPGVLRRWIDTQPEAIEMMYKTAKDAFEYKYNEIVEIFVKLFEEDYPLFSAAMYYALSPEIHSVERWNELKKTIKDVDHCQTILNLNVKGLLASQQYPSFGLTIRYQVARDTVIQKFRSHCVYTLKTWKNELHSQKGFYLSAVTKYVSTLLETLEPDLNEKQLRIRLESAFRLVHDVIAPSVRQEVLSLR